MVRADASIWISWILPMSTLLILVKGRIMSPKVSPTEIASRLPSRSLGPLSGMSGNAITPIGALVW